MIIEETDLVMRNSIIAIALITAPLHPVLSHPDHEADQPAKRSPEHIAQSHVRRLIAKAKLPASWARASYAGHSETKVRGAVRTTVLLSNSAEPKSKQFYKVVLASNGNVVSSYYVN
jgi:hypothetical protein